MAAKRPAPASLRYAKAPLSPRYRRKLHQPLGHSSSNWQWLTAGAILAFYSSVGQTFFLGLFSPYFMAAFGLSHSTWGAMFSVATLAAAVCLLLTGGLMDRWRIRTGAVAAVLLVSLVCIGVYGAQSQGAFFVAIFGLRFLGMGALYNLSAVAMMRWFRSNRGRAVAIASLGLSVGDALVPLVTVALIAALGWRQTWLVVAAFLCLSLPILWGLLRRERSPDGTPQETSFTAGLDGRHWQAGAVLRHRLFRLFVPLMATSEFVSAMVFFNSATLAIEKGWALSDVALAFPILMVATFIAAYIYGVLVDAHGADRFFPWIQLPMATAFFCLAIGDQVIWLYIAFVCVGFHFAGNDTVHTLILPQFYGNRHLGSLRGLKSFLQISGGALAPVLSGVLLDQGISISRQYLFVIGWIVLAAGLAFWGTRIARHHLSEGLRP